ncbi:MAG: hypothetical protein Q7N50_08935 [Armatimonadota bacterium]|nr:hypothetical protein [Armatimonadota bacterium]
MRKMVPYIKLSLAGLLLAVSLTTALWEYKINAPTNNWNKIAPTQSQNRKPLGYKMMVYVDRPIMRSDQICKTYLRIKNTSKRPLEFTSTYITNRYYINGKLCGEEVGDRQMPGSPLKLMPGAVKDVLLKDNIKIRFPGLMNTIGTRGFQFCGYRLQTNTVTIYVLPSRAFWLVLTAIAALAVWRVWLGTTHRQRIP